MHDYYVVVGGRQHGPYNQSKVRAMLHEERIDEDAEIYDAVTGDAVLPDDILNPPSIFQGGNAVQEAAAWQAATPQMPDEPHSDAFDPGLVLVVVAFFCPLAGLIGGLIGIHRARETGHPATMSWLAICISFLMIMGSCGAVGYKYKEGAKEHRQYQQQR